MVMSDDDLALGLGGGQPGRARAKANAMLREQEKGRRHEHITFSKCMEEGKIITYLEDM
jgi:hypothetical protein